jgi:hypothetical protein
VFLQNAGAVEPGAYLELWNSGTVEPWNWFLKLVPEHWCLIDVLHDK